MLSATNQVTTFTIINSLQQSNVLHAVTFVQESQNDIHTGHIWSLLHVYQHSESSRRPLCGIHLHKSDSQKPISPDAGVHGAVYNNVMVGKALPQSWHMRPWVWQRMCCLILALYTCRPKGTFLARDASCSMCVGTVRAKFLQVIECMTAIMASVGSAIRVHMTQVTIERHTRHQALLTNWKN